MLELGEIEPSKLYGNTERIALLLKNYEGLKQLNTVESKTITMDLDRAVKNVLNEFQQKIVYLYFKSGYTQEETAQRLQVYPTKVFIECLRVLERLKIYLNS